MPVTGSFQIWPAVGGLDSAKEVQGYAIKTNNVIHAYFVSVFIIFISLFIKTRN
jgi:hypothetical protein